MGEAYRNLGQSFPAANTLTTLYTVPALTSAIVSSIIVCNASGSNGNTDSFRISIAVAGTGDTLAQYIYYDIDIDQQDTFIATVGLTLATTDIIRVHSLNGHCTFAAWGTQIT